MPYQNNRNYIYKSSMLLIFFSLAITMIYAQPHKHLSDGQESLVRISATTSVGNLEALKDEISAGLANGLTINEIKEALVQLYAYCGFPRSLNAINTFRELLAERAAAGIVDMVGKDFPAENNRPDRYEQGRKVLEVLTKMPQPKPAPGFGEFAPRIDAFLKEHLFADVFASDVLSFQQRELVTIAALASMEGAAAQLKSHLGMGINTGLTTDQLDHIASIIQTVVGEKQAASMQGQINTIK